SSHLAALMDVLNHEEPGYRS
ncbi:MAG: hypothetical protein VW881_01360, partial [Alphaproteobacteria bacterium]